MMIRQNSIAAWFLAARPKTLTAACIPVMVGWALAHGSGVSKPMPVIICLVFASLMQIAANFINDLLDFLKGTDGNDRLGPERACAQGWISPRAMKKGVAIALFAAAASGLSLVCWGGWWLVLVGVACVVFAFLYTAMLSYCGLGDVLVLVFFGFVPVFGTYYVQANSADGVPLFLCAAACGLAVDALLVVNNYRDRHTDRASGKRTLIVMGGERFGRYLYLGVGLCAVVCCLPLVIYGKPVAAFLPLLYLIPHIRSWKRMVKINSGRELNGILAETSANMLLFAILLSIGLIIR